MPRLHYLLPVLLITGCAVLPARVPDEVAQAWAMRQQALTPVSRWELRGRIALRGRDEGLQASLHWVRGRSHQQIHLVGPLGSGQLRLTQDANGAELRDTGKNVQRAPTLRQLLANATGWDVPFDDMEWWVRGLPAPGTHAGQEFDDSGRLKLLTQLGWEVEFLEYGRYGEHDLPRRLFARRYEFVPGVGLNHVTLEVRVAIERWTLPDK